MSLPERLLVAGLLIVTSCSGPSSVPATTPTTRDQTTTTGQGTTTSPPATTATSTTGTDRLAEIEAIFQDLEQRRLTALYEGDRQAFAALFANEEYLARSLEVFDQAEFTTPPLVEVEVLDVLFDDDDCIAVRSSLTRTDLEESYEPLVRVVESIGTTWGFSFVGEGWACVGPHPFAS